MREFQEPVVIAVLHFSSLLATLLYTAVTTLIYYAFGYTFLNKIIRVKLRDYGTMVSLPIYLTAGIILFTLVLYPIGMLVFNVFVVAILIVLVFVFFLGDIVVSARRSATTNNELAPDKRPRKKTESPADFLAGLVFVMSLVYIAAIIAVFEWPPQGDLINHGFYTSLIIYDQRIPVTYSPLRDVSFHYPLGFHINAAFLTLLLGIYPGESVFLFGGVLMIALTSLVYALAYIVTRSKLLSLVPYVLLYLTYSPAATGSDLEKYVFGYLFNGPYPNIYGFLIVIFSVATLVIYAKSKDRTLVLRVFPILMSALLLTYPSFILIPLMLLVLASFQIGIRNLVRDCIRTRRDILVTLFLLAFSVWVVLYTYSQVVVTQIQVGQAVPTSYALPSDYILGSVFGYSIIMASIFSFFLIILSFMRGKRSSLSLSESRELVELRPVLLTYVLATLVLMVSLIPQVFDLLQYLLVSRLAIIVMVLSLVLNVYALGRVLDIIVKRLHRSTLSMSLTENRKKMIIGLSMLLFFSSNGLLIISVPSHASLQLAERYAWYSHQPSFQDDSKALEWVCGNVKEWELILNDFSWSGLYLLSFSIKNISMHYALRGFERAEELQKIWLHPDNVTLVHSLIKKYNVSYVLVTSELGFYDYLVDSRYKPKPYLPACYVLMFYTYDFLELVFRSGSSVVFKVR